MMKRCRSVGEKGYSFLQDFVNLKEGGQKVTMKVIQVILSGYYVSNMLIL